MVVPFMAGDLAGGFDGPEGQFLSRHHFAFSCLSFTDVITDAITDST